MYSYNNSCITWNFSSVLFGYWIFLTDQQNLYYPELSSRLFEGDILDAPIGDSRNAINIETYKWPKGVVPYEFSKDFGKYNTVIVFQKCTSKILNMFHFRVVVKRKHRFPTFGWEKYTSSTITFIFLTWKITSIQKCFYRM